MGIPDGAHTHGGGGSGLGQLFLIVLAVAVLGPAVATAGAELLHVLIIVLVVLAVVAAGGLVALGTWRLRQTRPDTPRVVYRATAVPPRLSPPLSAPQLPAIERTHEVHLHLHGISAEDIAPIFDHQTGHDHG
jgi:hypothetical protein